MVAPLLTPPPPAPVELADEAAHPVDRHVAVASQWQLMWWAFCRHRLAVAGLVVTSLLYLIALLPDVFAINDPVRQNARAVYHPPHRLRLIDNLDGGWTFKPHVVAYTMRRDPKTLSPIFQEDSGRQIELTFLGRGYSYSFLGLFDTDIHLFATENPTDPPVFLLGADRLGRCVFSRIVYGARISLFLGLSGVIASLIIGVLLGGISGYYGGKIDFAIQRAIEFVLALPTIPIWLAMAAALPHDWPPTYQYFLITLILSLLGWAQLARVVRGRFLSLRTEDFVVAARLDGASEGRIIFRHMLPSFMSHIIASVTLAVPAMILAETSLSFLGLGLQPPVISWGVLLREAQNIRSIASAPWLFFPGAAVVIAVLAMNFLGDGLRDAADPYNK